MTEDFLSTREAAEILGISERAIRKWIDEGHLRATRVNPGISGSPYRIPVSEIERILDERKRQLGEGA